MHDARSLKDKYAFLSTSDPSSEIQVAGLSGDPLGRPASDRRGTPIRFRKTMSFGSSAVVQALSALRKGSYPLPPEFARLFRVERFLGAGTFGDVFSAVRTAESSQFPDRIAVKLVPRDATDGGLSFEMDYAPSLTNPRKDGRKRLRRYLDANWEDDTFYWIAMEWLGDRVLSLEDALDVPQTGFVEGTIWLKQVLEGLEFLHSRKIEHGDIHWKNILLVPEGKRGGSTATTNERLEAIIADLGEAKVVSDAFESVGQADVLDFLRMCGRIVSKLDARAGGSAGLDLSRDESYARAGLKAMLARSIAAKSKKGSMPTAMDLRRVLESRDFGTARL